MSESNSKQPKKPFFEVAKDTASGRWHWVLWTANGRQIATNVIDYETPKDAIRGIESAKTCFAEAETIVKASD